jgi:hypothetical protein
LKVKGDVLTTHVVLIIGSLFVGWGVFFYLLAGRDAADKPLVSKVRKRLAFIYGSIGTALIVLYFLTRN